MNYGVRFEESSNGIGAYLPDVPGVAVVGEDLVDALMLMKKALQWHVDGLIEDGVPIPDSTKDLSQYEFFVIAEPFVLAFSETIGSLIKRHENLSSLREGNIHLQLSHRPLELPPKEIIPLAS